MIFVRSAGRCAAFALAAALALIPSAGAVAQGREPCDFAIPIRIENGTFAVVCGEALWHQRLYLYINTRPGERVMRPDYGFTLESYLLEPVTDESLAAMAAHARRELQREFPDLAILETEVRLTGDVTPRIEIVLAYKVRSSGSIYHNIVKYLTHR